MKKLFRFFFNHWTMAILGLAAISLLIWYVGPMVAVAPGDDVTANIEGIGSVRARFAVTLA